MIATGNHWDFKFAALCNTPYREWGTRSVGAAIGCPPTLVNIQEKRAATGRPYRDDATLWCGASLYISQRALVWCKLLLGRAALQAMFSILVGTGEVV